MEGFAAFGIPSSAWTSLVHFLHVRGANAASTLDAVTRNALNSAMLIVSSELGRSLEKLKPLRRWCKSLELSTIDGIECLCHVVGGDALKVIPSDLHELFILGALLEVLFGATSCDRELPKYYADRVMACLSRAQLLAGSKASGAIARAHVDTVLASLRMSDNTNAEVSGELTSLPALLFRARRARDVAQARATSRTLAAQGLGLYPRKWITPPSSNMQQSAAMCFKAFHAGNVGAIILPLHVAEQLLKTHVFVTEWKLAVRRTEFRRDGSVYIVWKCFRSAAAQSTTSSAASTCVPTTSAGDAAADGAAENATVPASKEAHTHGTVLAATMAAAHALAGLGVASVAHESDAISVGNALGAVLRKMKAVHAAHTPLGVGCQFKIIMYVPLSPHVKHVVLVSQGGHTGHAPGSLDDSRHMAHHPSVEHEIPASSTPALASEVTPTRWSRELLKEHVAVIESNVARAAVATSSGGTPARGARGRNGAVDVMVANRLGVPLEDVEPSRATASPVPVVQQAWCTCAQKSRPPLISGNVADDGDGPRWVLRCDGPGAWAPCDYGTAFHASCLHIGDDDAARFAASEAPWRCAACLRDAEQRGSDDVSSDEDDEEQELVGAARSRGATTETPASGDLPSVFRRVTKLRERQLASAAFRGALEAASTEGGDLDPFTVMTRAEKRVYHDRYGVEFGTRVGSSGNVSHATRVGASTGAATASVATASLLQPTASAAATYVGVVVGTEAAIAVPVTNDVAHSLSPCTGVIMRAAATQPQSSPQDQGRDTVRHSTRALKRSRS